MKQKSIVFIFLFGMMLTTSLFGVEAYQDNFDGGQNYGNNNGTVDFTSNWYDSEDQNASTGQIYIDAGNYLVLEHIEETNTYDYYIERHMNLERVLSPKLYVRYDGSNSGGEVVSVQMIGTDGNWHEIGRLDNNSAATDLIIDPIPSDYLLRDAVIRFRSGSGDWNDGDVIKIQYVRVEFEYADTDGDGVTDNTDIDDDNDGILDSIEMQGDGSCAYGFFQVIKGQLKLYDVSYGVYVDIGEDHKDYNGMGYDTRTGKLYATVKDTTTDDYGNNVDYGDIVEIDRHSGKIRLIYDGTDDTPGSSAQSSAADFYDGKLYFVAEDDGNTLYTWDAVTNTLHKIGSDNLGKKLADIAIVVDYMGYAVAYGAKTTDTTSGASDNTEFYTIDLSDGHVDTVTMTITTPDGGDLDASWGAAFVADDDKLYLANNNGYIYRIEDYDTPTPRAIFAYRSETTKNNDGASCRHRNQFPAETDGDGLDDYLDLDSDNDGISDNVEAQATGSYQAPSGNDGDGDGLDDNYDSTSGGAGQSVGLIPPDTDRDLTSDFLDADADNDGYTDCEEGLPDTTANKSCPIGSVEGNGRVSWVGSSDYSDINGIVDTPSSDLFNETGDTSEVGYREFLCGKALTKLTAYNWKLISMPCDTGPNTVDQVFGFIGTYGTNYVLYKQTGSSDNYEVNETAGSTHKNTDKTKLGSGDTLEQGISYWIITDNNVTVTIDENLSNLAPTDTNATSNIGIDDPDFNQTMQHTLPNNDMNNSGWVKKFMAGNPFPYAFDMKNLYFSHGGSSGSYNAMGDGGNDTYIDPTFYKHDSPDTSDKNTSNGGGYEAVNAGTPGFDKGGFKAMEGFFIKLPEVNGDTAVNEFAYPLMMQNGNGN